MKLIILLLSINGFAGVFGEDDRISPSEANSINYLLSQSVPALIPQSKIKQNENGHYSLIGTSYKSKNICSDEKFADESIIANCSASLVGSKTVLTAAHCFLNNYTCDKYRVVFDYVDGNTEISQDNLYSCKNVIFEKFDETLQGDDIALIELDREVVGRKPIRLELRTRLKKGDQLSMIGYPYGMSQKVVEVGKVLSVDKKTSSFDHDLDSFSVNSGGPIFNSKGIQVGVLVRGTGANIVMDEKSQCYRWGVEKTKGFASGNLLEIIRPYMKSVVR